MGQEAQASPVDVIIAGGGLAGLIAAYELQKHGLSSHVLEATERFGGRVATARHEGGLWGDYGMRELWEGDCVMDYARELAIPLSTPEPPHSSFVEEERLHPYTQGDRDAWLETIFSANELSAHTGWLGWCESLLDEAERQGLTHQTQPLQDVSFAAWLASCCLPLRVAEFVRLAVECEVGADWSDFSALYGLQQVRVFLRGGEPCRRVLGGSEQLIDPLLERLPGPRTLDARVLRIVRRRDAQGRVDCAVEFLNGDAMRIIHAPRVIVAVPYHSLHAIEFEPSLTPMQWAAVNSLRGGRYTVVHLLLDPAANDLLHAAGFPILTRGPLGVIYGPDAPPDGGQEQVFTLLVHGAHADDIQAATPESRALLGDELDRRWPGFSRFVRDLHVYPHPPAATPVWPVGRSPYDPLSASLREENVGLHLAGDYVYGCHAEAAVRSAREAAARVARQLAPEKHDATQENPGEAEPAG